MKNIYDIRKDKQLYYILPDNISINDSEKELNKAAVIVHLYYQEEAEWYLKQLTVVPNGMDIYVISPISEIRKSAEEKGFFIIKKENRGRDISALLVASKSVIERYEYICFLHDKRAGGERFKEDVKLWIENLWLNTIASEKYIRNVLDLFYRNQNIGVLVPPEPIGNEWFVWGNDLWRNNYENTKVLSEMLSLECNICREKAPITIGTVFWCRVKALTKLFDRKWNYDDFPNEPMPDDGTISHAIERIMGYVAQDAGYDTGTIVTQSYAAKQILFYTDFVGKALGEYLPVNGIRTVHQFDCKISRMRKIKAFFDKYQKVFLYGAGTVGRKGLLFLRENGCEPSGFLVSETKDEEYIDGIPVILKSEIDDWDGCGIIVSVGQKLCSEVETLIKESIKCEYIFLNELMIG